MSTNKTADDRCPRHDLLCGDEMCTCAPDPAEVGFGDCRHGTLFAKARRVAGDLVHDLFLRRTDGALVELTTGTTLHDARTYALGFKTGSMNDVPESPWLR